MLQNIERNTVQVSQLQARDGNASAGVQLFGALAQSSSQMRSQLQPYLDQQTRDRAARDVREAIEDRDDTDLALDVPTRRVLTRQDEIYNQVVTAGVVAQSQADFFDEVNKLKEEYKFDPTGYAAAAEEFVEGYTSGLTERELSMETVLGLETSAREVFAREGARLEDQARQIQVKETQDQMERRLSQLSAQLATGIERDHTTFIGSDEFADIQKEFDNIINTLVDNPLYGWSAERGAEALDDFMNGGTELLMVQGMEAEYHENGAAAALGFIDESVNRMTLDTQERIGARSRLSNRLSILQQMTALEQKEAKEAAELLTKEGEQAALDYEADMLGKLSQGIRPTAADVQTGQLFVRAGYLKPARLNVYVNAKTSDQLNGREQGALFGAIQYARDFATTREDLDSLTQNLLTTEAIGIDEISKVEREWEDSQDARLKAGTDLLDSFFQKSWMDIGGFGAAAAANSEARIDLRNWVDQNPESTPAQVQSQARKIADAYARNQPPPPMVVMDGFKNPTGINPTNYETYIDDASIYLLDNFADDPEFLNATMERLNIIEDYYSDMAQLQSEGSEPNKE